MTGGLQAAYKQSLKLEKKDAGLNEKKDEDFITKADTVMIQKIVWGGEKIYN